MGKHGGGPGVPPAYGTRDALVGRDREVSEVRGLVAAHRLVTVVGGVGVGKSRLAAAALPGAGRTRTGPGPRERVVRVRWRGTRPATPGQVAAAVFHAVTGAPPRSGPVGVADVATRLAGSGRTLLFLDDMDAAHRACVGVVRELLEAVPGLRVLVTARQPLGLGEERVCRLGPLPVSAGAAGVSPAAELFLAAVREACGDAVADAVGPAAAEEVCRSLEGLPLAITMAAQQLADRSADELARALRHGQCWLTSERAALRRHRSLRSAVGAAYALCDRTERVVWARGSVFAGGFDESAAAFVCVGGSVAPQDVPACLARLAAAGVLELMGEPGGLRAPRYRMARAARDFGTERLWEAGEAEIAAERLAVHARRVAVVAEGLWNAGGQAQAAQLLSDERENLHAVLDRAVRRPEQASEVLETVAGLWFWWVVYGEREAGLRHLLRLLPHAPADRPVTVRALWLAAWLSACDAPRTADELLRRAWPAAVMLGDSAAVGRIAHVQGVLALHEGALAEAADHFREAASLVPARAPGGPSPAVSLAALAVAQAGFAPGAAHRTARRALAQREARGDAWATLVARYARAYVDQRRGHPGRAWRRTRRALASLDARLPLPYGSDALRRLLEDLERGAPGRPPHAAKAAAPAPLGFEAPASPPRGAPPRDTCAAAR
ncbi:ATP-binding protein [Streptomyces sp. enrichment culture]|uniref:ATP-binding protein n=1 Tax=Streptomyces sp. enrichment culture TaxID=1795815 RepID=UPI003F55014C